MIVLQKGTTASVALTLSENATLTAPYYLLVFQNTVDMSKVRFVASDTSNFPERFNLFTINVNTYFTGKDPGFWNYKVYEQSSSSNTDEDLTGKLLEEGIMQLKESTAESYVEYSGNEEEEYITHNGE